MFVFIPYVFEFQSYVTEHHVYKDTWTPILGEKYQRLRNRNTITTNMR